MELASVTYRYGPWGGPLGPTIFQPLGDKAFRDSVIGNLL